MDRDKLPANDRDKIERNGLSRSTGIVGNVVNAYIFEFMSVWRINMVVECRIVLYPLFTLNTILKIKIMIMFFNICVKQDMLEKPHS